MLIVVLSILIYLLASSIEVLYAKNNRSRIFITKLLFYILFAYYALFLTVVLLFSDFFFIREQMYGVNKIPFKTISSFFHVMKYNNDLNAFANLIGNAILFAPLGIFLPLTHKIFKNPFIFIIVTTITVSIMEFLQFHFKVGSADVDDIILNVFGAIVVFCIVKLFIFITKDHIHFYFKD